MVAARRADFTIDNTILRNQVTSLLPIANGPTTGPMREHLVGALARVIPQDIRTATACLTPMGSST